MSVTEVSVRTVHATRSPYIRHHATTGGVGMAYGPRGYLYELADRDRIWVDQPGHLVPKDGFWNSLPESSVVEFARKVARVFGRGTRIVITDANTGEQIERVAA